VRICFICVEIFAWGKYGGFGRATRLIGGELVKRGLEVFAVVPRREGQKPVEDLDGIRVLGFHPRRPWEASRLFREVAADVYHSSEPSFGSWLAMRACPEKKHIVTVRDPRDFEDWRMEFELPSLSRFQVFTNWLYETNPIVRHAVRRMDRVYTCADTLIPKVHRLYRLAEPPGFLPTPVEVLDTYEKAKTPTVCSLARIDRRKRPEIFCELAAAYPEVRFLIAGKSRDPAYGRDLEARYGSLPNLEFLGFVDQFRTGAKHSDLLEKSWILVNTANREGLPNAFLEAAAHGCAILSAVDPDGFASRFGYRAKDDDFARGLAWLLEERRWEERGRTGNRHVKAVFGTEHAIDCHVEIYRDLVSPGTGPRET
jgi:glycosyltransferase involved in cell wall biosynthesis